jgi:hypothetical protein
MDLAGFFHFHGKTPKSKIGHKEFSGIQESGVRIQKIFIFAPGSWLLAPGS